MNWLAVKNTSDSAEILIQGEIGQNPWDDSGTSEKQFTDALSQIPEGKQITVGINSQGGSVKDGLGIYNALIRRGDAVTTRIDGYAVSIASVIALAGARRISPKSSVWMIHEPAMLAFGNAEDMDKARKALEAHAEVIASIYQDRTKLSSQDARDKMKAETWFRGDEAVSWGFATDGNDSAVALNSLDATKFKNIPDFAKQQILAASQSAAISAGIVADGGACPAAGKEPKGNQMPENTTAAQTPPDNSALILDALKQIKDELATRHAAPPVSPPPVTASTPITITSEGLQDLLKTKGNTAAQYEFMKREFTNLKRSYPLLPVNANTDSASGALTVSMLGAGFVTVLQNKVASLNAFARNLAQGRIGRNSILIPKITAGGTAQSNPTNFEDTTNFVSSVSSISVTPAQIVAGAHLTNAELQNGWAIEWFAEVKAAEFADKIASLVNAVITTGNFTATPVVSSAAAFGVSELRTLWGQLKKSGIKNIILDGEYYAQFMPANLEAFDPMNGSRFGGWWNVFEQHTNWTGATANTVGFACNPQAIGVGAGLPDVAPNGPGAGNLVESVMTMENNGMQVSNFMWFSPASRTMWWTLEAMFAAAAGDTSAGVLIKSA